LRGKGGVNINGTRTRLCQALKTINFESLRKITVKKELIKFLLRLKIKKSNPYFTFKKIVWYLKDLGTDKSFTSA